MFKFFSTRRKLISSIEENNALQKLAGTLENHVPWTSSSLSAGAVVKVLNDIVINRRRNIVEFGGGLSTLYIAKILKQLDEPSSIITIEHDQQWLKLLEKLIKKEGVAEKVSLIHAPLSSYEGQYENWGEWYCSNSLKELERKGGYDVVLVDGPPAYRKEWAFRRAPAIPYLLHESLLSRNCSIWLDDINRNGERKILSKWQKLLESKAIIDKNSNIGYFLVGKAYNID